MGSLNRGKSKATRLKLSTKKAGDWDRRPLLVRGREPGVSYSITFWCDSLASHLCGESGESNPA